MDELTQTLINDLVKRVGTLEAEVKVLKANKGASQNAPLPSQTEKINASKTENASPKQLKFIRDLGIDVDSDISKFEAKMLIKEGLDKRDGIKNDDTTPQPEQTNTPQQEKNDQSVEAKGLPSTEDVASTAKSKDGESPVEEKLDGCKVCHKTETEDGLSLPGIYEDDGTFTCEDCHSKKDGVYDEEEKFL
jgi:hypothetical protein